MESYYYCKVDDEAITHAVENLNEVEERRSADICSVRNWLQTQQQLNAKTDDATILRFLRGCKFDFERAKLKISNFYQLRSKCPEWFSCRNPLLPQIQELLDLGVFLPLKQRDSQGHRVMLIRATAHSPFVIQQNDVFKTCMMVLDCLLEEDETISVYGVIAVIDLQGVTLAHALQLTPNIIFNAVHAWQDCYPVRIRRIDFINCPLHVNVVLNIFRKFMRDKLRKRVHTHRGCSSSLHKHINPNILPKEYGGTDGSLQELKDYWKNHIIEKKDWFVEEENYKANK